LKGFSSATQPLAAFYLANGVFFSVPDIRSDQNEYDGKIKILTPQQPNIIIRNFSGKMTFSPDYFARPLYTRGICMSVHMVNGIPQLNTCCIVLPAAPAARPGIRLVIRPVLAGPVWHGIYRTVTAAGYCFLRSLVLLRGKDVKKAFNWRMVSGCLKVSAPAYRCFISTL
jgi:hypothetical protein